MPLLLSSADNFIVRPRTVYCTHLISRRWCPWAHPSCAHPRRHSNSNTQEVIVISVIFIGFFFVIGARSHLKATRMNPSSSSSSSLLGAT